MNRYIHVWFAARGQGWVQHLHLIFVQTVLLSAFICRLTPDICGQAFIVWILLVGLTIMGGEI